MGKEYHTDRSGIGVLSPPVFGHKRMFGAPVCIGLGILRLHEEVPFMCWSSHADGSGFEH